MAVSEIPVTAYTTPTEVIIQAAQDEVIALINQFLALLPDPLTDAASGVSSAGQGSPDYDAMRPEMAVNIRTEIAALSAAVDAASTSQQVAV